MPIEHMHNDPIHPKSVEIHGEPFEFVVLQRGGKSAVYRGAHSYLRIGDPEKINADLAFHRKMEDAGFPVARVITEGEVSGQAYFIETSLGDKLLSKSFAGDVEKTGSISQEHFTQFLQTVERFAKAQLRTRTEEKDFGEFARGIHLDILCEELPEYADKIRARFELMQQRLAPYPFVTTHGDFNPSNMYPDGVIDFEDSFHASFGYDLLGALTHIDYFPDSRDSEYFAKYRYSESQKQEYLALLDRICNDAGLPVVSGVKDEIEFSKAIWQLVRMHEWPKIQKFRYEKFIEKFLND